MSNNVGNYTKPREDEDIHFRVPEESEKMLVEDWVPPTGRVKK
jgi:hypothetical protein